MQDADPESGAKADPESGAKADPESGAKADPESDANADPESGEEARCRQVDVDLLTDRVVQVVAVRSFHYSIVGVSVVWFVLGVESIVSAGSSG